MAEYGPREFWYDISRTSVMLALRFCCGIGIRAEGRDNVPRRGGFILASNHCSNLDPMVLGIACPRQLNYMAKEELFRNRFFGGLLFSVGAFPVRRGAGDLSAIRRAFERVRGGKGLLLFPQGGRRPIDDTGEPEPGIGMLSKRMGVPVIPVFVSGTHTALPPGSSRPKKGAIRVRFGKPLDMGGGKDYRDAAGRIMRAIRELGHD